MKARDVSASPSQVRVCVVVRVWSFFSASFLQVLNFTIVAMIRNIQLNKTPTDIETRPFFESENIADFRFLLYYDQIGRFSLN